LIPPQSPDASGIVFVAGEASGDLLAAPVVAALARHRPPVHCAGIAGERMIAAGCEPWHHVRELSVRGYWEVLRELPRLLLLRRALERRVRAGSCDALVGVDAPDFNLALETAVRSSLPTIHYVSPSIWAWRAERIERIRRAADRVLLVFPFEEAIYRRAGIPASYVGHPLASEIPLQPDRAAARARLGLAADALLICLMPGSRRAEIASIAPVFFDAARHLLRSAPQARFLVPVADAGLRVLLESLRAAAPEAAPRIELVDGRSHDCLEACDGVLVASGTATLEAALYKRPMVIAYRMPAVSAWIMRRIGGYLPWVGLPNILAGESLVPELLQEQATGAALAAALQDSLDHPTRQRELAERFTALHESLRRDTPALAAEAILHTVALVRATGRGRP
jgi:lipid-A-disaccharide synthase